MSGLPYSEIYDEKGHNIRRRVRYPLGRCGDCGCYSGHAYNCPKVTPEDLAVLLRESQENEERTCATARRYLSALQTVSGKLAIVRHENNKLRKANERLRLPSIGALGMAAVFTFKLHVEIAQGCGEGKEAEHARDAIDKVMSGLTENEKAWLRVLSASIESAYAAKPQE